MIRTFCDLCNCELTKDTDQSVFADLRMYTAHKSTAVSLHVSASASRDAASYGREVETLRDVCRHCVIDAVKTKDKRPKDPMPVKQLGDFTLVEIKGYLRNPGRAEPD